MGTKKGMLIASAAASLIIAGTVLVRAESPTEKGSADMVMCSGVNECKGKGACAGAGHSCGGKNECKGKGVVSLSKADCEKKGGKVAEPKM